MRGDWRFKWAGYVGWLAVAAPTFVDLWAGTLSGWRAVAWVMAFLAYGITYATYLRPETPHVRRSVGVWQVVLLTAMGFVMVVTSVGHMKYLASITLTIVAGELPYLLPRRLVLRWVTAQSLILAGVFWWSFGWLAGVAGGAAYTGFQLFSLGKAWIELRERSARRELGRANAELRATRTLLAESTRVAERQRISRDLHDSLGHHLTALSLQLEVASRKITDGAGEHIHEAHAIVRLLLADIRNVVGELRRPGDIELGAAIRSLCTADGFPRVHVDMPETLYVETAAQANTLLRSAQEIVTNALRHADAHNVWIRVQARDGGIALHGKDDGRGATSVLPGHGLTGMRERFEEQGGTVSFTTTEGRGFAVDAFLPRREPPP